MNQNFTNEFNSQIDTLILNETLKNHCSMGVGGPALYYFQKDNVEKIQKAIKLCKKFNINYHFLGGGTNTIFSDSGFNGLIIKPDFKQFEILSLKTQNFMSLSIPPRHDSLSNSNYSTDLLNSFVDNTQKVLVKVGSSWRVNALFQKCLTENITGLEWFTGIPGTVGGAIYMNIHGGNYFFSDFLQEVEILTQDGETQILQNKDLKFNYDISRFHQNKDLIISATLVLYKGNVEKAKNIFQNWGLAKTQTQPQKSSGCMFQNLSKEETKKLNLPASSMGYIIDKILNLKGKQIGNAKISNSHAAFIENLGNAKASDIFALTKIIENKFQNHFGFKPKLEVEFIGKF